MTKVGTGYVEIEGNFEPLHRQLEQLRATWKSQFGDLGDRAKQAIVPALAQVSTRLKSTGKDVDQLGSRADKLDGSLTGVRRAADQAAKSITRSTGASRGLASEMDRARAAVDKHSERVVASSRAVSSTLEDQLSRVRKSAQESAAVFVAAEREQVAAQQQAQASSREYVRQMAAQRAAVGEVRTGTQGFSADLRQVRAALTEARGGAAPFANDLQGARRAAAEAADATRRLEQEARNAKWFRRLGKDSDVVSRALGGLNGRIGGINQRFMLLRNVMGTLKWPAIITGVGLAAQALSGLGAGLVAVTAAVGPLVGVLGSLPELLSTAAQGFGVFKLATAGIVAAVKEQITSQTTAGVSAVRSASAQRSAAKAIETAMEGVRTAKLAVRDATRNLANAEYAEGQSLAALTQARRDAKQAIKDASIALTDATLAENGATIALRDARESLAAILAGPDELELAEARGTVTGSTHDLERAEIGLTDAREALKRITEGATELELADARNQAGDATRALKHAELDLQDQIEKTNKVLADATSTDREKENASLDLADAEDRVTDARRNSGEATKTLKDLEAGPSASDLAKARLDVSDAENRVEAARRAVTKATKELKALEAGPGDGDVLKARQNVWEAEQNLSEAIRGRQKATSDVIDLDARGVGGSQQVLSALRDAKEATRGVADAKRGQREAERNVTLALAAVTEAQRDANDSAIEAAAGAAGLTKAFDTLPAPAQAFARTLISLKPKLDELRNTAAAGFFPGATAGLTDVVKNFGVVNRVTAITSRVLGGLAAEAGKLVGSKGFGRDLGVIGERNAGIIRRLGRAAINVGDALRHVMVAAGPLTTWLSKVAEGWAASARDSANAGRESGRLAAFFERTRAVLERLGSIIGNVAAAFKNIGSAAVPLGNAILSALDRASEGWARWTKSIDGQQSLAKYFADAKPAVFEMGRLARDLVKSFLALGNQEGAAKLIRQIRTELLPALERGTASITKSFGPALVTALTKVARLFEEMAGVGGPLATLVKFLGGFAGGVATLLDKVPGLKAFATTLIVVGAGLKAMKLVAAASGMTALGGAITSVAGAHRALAAGTTLSTVAQERGIAATVGAKIAMIAAAVAARTYAAAQWLVNIALTANPIGAVVLGLAALVGGFVYAYKHSEKFRDIVNGVWDALKKGAEDAFEWVKTAASNIVRFVSDRWDDVKTATRDAWGWIKSHLGTILPAIALVVTGPIGGLVVFVVTHWDTIKTKTREAWQRVKDFISNPIEAAVGAVKTAIGDVKNWLGDRWEDIKAGASTAWQRVKDLIGNPIQSAVDTVKSIIGHGGKDRTGLVGWLAGAWDGIKETAGAFAGDFAGIIKKPFKAAANAVATFVELIVKAIDKIPGIDMGDQLEAIAGFKGKIDGLAHGGQMSAAGIDHFATGGEVRRGTQIKKPMIMMGEEAPKFAEWVIPTNPAYRDRARMLLGKAAEAIGFATGGTFAASQFGGHDDPSAFLRTTASGLQANDLLWGFAELSNPPSSLNFSALGGLPMFTKLDIRYAGKTAEDVPKVDVGAGGPGRLGRVRGVDLTYAVAQALGFPGAGLVSVSPSGGGGGGGGLGGFLGGVGGTIGGAARGIAGIPGGLLSQGAQWILDKLPNPADLLPDWLLGTGKYVIDQVTGWVKDQVAGILPSFGGGGVGGYTGPPADQKKFGDNSYVDSHTLAVTAWLDKKFGLTMSSAYRSPEHNKAIGGAPGSLHTHGSTSNPGATDSVGSRSAMDAYIAYARQHIAGLQEAMVDNYSGTGWNAHLGFFAKGGKIGGSDVIQAPFVGTFHTGGVVEQTGLALVEKGETITPRGGDGVTLDDIVAALEGIDLYVGGEKIDERIEVRMNDRHRKARGSYTAGRAL